MEGGSKDRSKRDEYGDELRCIFTNVDSINTSTKSDLMNLTVNKRNHILFFHKTIF